MLLRPDWMMLAESAKDGKVPPHKVRRRPSIQFSIWGWVKGIVLAPDEKAAILFPHVMYVQKPEDLFRILAVQVDIESWEDCTDSNRHDEHQECEIDINKVGRAEKGGEGRMVGQMRRDRTEVWDRGST